MFENSKINIENTNILLTMAFILIPYLTWLIKQYVISDCEKNIVMNISKRIKTNKKFKINQKNKNGKKKIGLLTNELPPIIYGGVSTWILMFMSMFKKDKNYDVIPIFLAYQDQIFLEDQNLDQRTLNRWAPCFRMGQQDI